jgi:hypothetical protein
MIKAFGHDKHDSELSSLGDWEKNDANTGHEEHWIMCMQVNYNLDFNSSQLTSKLS